MASGLQVLANHGQHTYAAQGQSNTQHEREKKKKKDVQPAIALLPRRKKCKGMQAEQERLLGAEQLVWTDAMGVGRMVIGDPHHSGGRPVKISPSFCRRGKASSHSQISRLKVPPFLRPLTLTSFSTTSSEISSSGLHLLLLYPLP